jgi:DNA-binding winged helix-turn-helix (wHTH) protein
MHKYYIINGIVEFHPAASTLRLLSQPDNVVVLNSPAGRCLLLLIERAGTIVTQQECMNIVWQQRGMLVSPNTYYQNISILRKGLKKAGIASDPVVTIPRIGLTLASDTQITIKESQLQDAQCAIETETETDIACPDAIQHPLPESVEKIPRSVDYRALKWRLSLTGVVLALMLLAWMSFATDYLFRDHYFVDGYRFAAASGECHVYLAKGIQTQREQAQALIYVEPFKTQCKSYPWVYVAWFSMLPRASLIRCDRPMEESNHCISDYFIEDH